MKVLSNGRPWKNCEGSITMIAENTEDMWHIYNLVTVGDEIRTKTTRKVQGVDIDTNVGKLRINGRNIVENDFIKMNAYHTIDLDIGTKFTLMKKCWDVICLERLELASNIEKSADLAVLLLQPGQAQFFLLTDDMMRPLGSKIEQNLPQKRAGKQDTSYIKCIRRFYESIYQTLKSLQFDVVKAVIVASPGLLNEEVYNFIFLNATQLDDKIILQNKRKFLKCHVTSGHSSCVKEILDDESVMSHVSDIKAVREVSVLNEFYKTLSVDQDKAVYGVDMVETAIQMNAVQQLMISDSLFRSSDFVQRKRFVKMVEDCRARNTIVHIFSSLHSSGKELDQLGGVACLLYFSLSYDSIAERTPTDRSPSDQSPQYRR